VGGTVSALSKGMNRNFWIKLCLISGLVAGTWYALAADGPAPESSSISQPSSRGTISTGMRAQTVNPFSVFSSFANSVSNGFSTLVSTVTDEMAAPMTAADVLASSPNPDAPPAESVDQEALQALSLDQSNAPDANRFARFPQPRTGISAANPSVGTDANSIDPATVPMVLPSGLSPSNSHATHTSGGGGSSGSSNIGLKSEDYVALLTSFKGTFNDQMQEVMGAICASDTNVCGSAGKNPIHSLRWSQDEGLNSAVSFAIKSIGPDLQFDLSFKIQKSSTSEEAVAFSLSPLSIDARNETANGKNLRTIEFRFADFQIRGETVYNARAKMVFENTSSGLIPTADSHFEFSRGRASIALTRWEPNAVVASGTGANAPIDPNLTPANPWINGINSVIDPNWVDEGDIGRKPSSQNSSYFLADELPFSIRIEKS
jgi:hypothetical protein